LDTYIQIDDETEVHLSSNTYNELGELIEKRLHEQTNGEYLQSIDYAYNIRGWLKSMNNSNSQNDDNADLFTMNLLYKDSIAGLTPRVQYNGNISAITWKNDVDTIAKGYGYSYDKLNRLKGAGYAEGETASSLTVNDKFTVNGLEYDLNGNIQNLQRRGYTGTPGNTDLMDSLVYYYEGNRIVGVNDESFKAEGFDDNGARYLIGKPLKTLEYTYDYNGNMTGDANKGISDISYNHMNLPSQISFENFAELHFLYDANGVKLRKYYYQDQSLYNYLDYCGNFVYMDGHLDHIFTSEGRIKMSADSIIGNEYFLKDHLGSVRVRFTDYQDPNTPNNTLYEEYYPFGMNINPTTTENPYKYNGKELYTDYDLDWYDYGFRFYDPQIARWHVPDPMAEKYAAWTPYNYALNNPLRYIDPLGLEVKNAHEEERNKKEQQKHEAKNRMDLQIRILYNNAS